MSESEFDLAADLWFRQNHPREALEHALRAVELDGSNAEASHLVALLYLDFCGHSKIGECRLDQAERYARKAISSASDQLAAENTLAVILIHQKRYDEAISILEPITRNILYPTPEIAWGNLGWAYLEKADPAGAVPALKRSVAAQPLFCVGNFRLGVAYHRLGQLGSAKDALDRALETDAPGCANLQDAYLERAQVSLAAGEVESARADLDHCLSLEKANPTGSECQRVLSGL